MEEAEVIILSQKKKDNHMILLICGIENRTQMNLSMKQKQTHRPREQTWGCPGGEGWGNLIGNLGSLYEVLGPLSSFQLQQN